MARYYSKLTMVDHSPNVLLTGGAGYIGSHTYLALHSAGFTPVILDDFSNSSPAVLDRLKDITGQPVLFRQGGIEDRALVEALINHYQIGAVIHFAGFKSVVESTNQPLKYYANNVSGTVGLLQSMSATSCRTLVFSSSATVYGASASSPIAENACRSYTNPYGHTKIICEDILSSVSLEHSDWRVGVLRYFNPVGAHVSGSIGEDPSGIPNNLMPYISQVAVGKRPYLSIYGDDYPTPDGTGVRDYIHVQDLAEGHVAALRALEQSSRFVVNLGTGCGYSVLDVVRAFERVSGKTVACQFVPRRAGDVAECYADPSFAQRLLGWHASRTLTDMCEDAWRWQRNNPNGYR